METTIRISLNGIAFNLNENAYQLAKNYTDDLKNHFGKDSEIIDDIEARIADLLSMRVKSSDQAIDINDIKEIIEIIGYPKDIDQEWEVSESDFKQHLKSGDNPKHHLYRDTDNKMIAGVCSGLSHYLKMNEAWIRIAFIMLALISLRFYKWDFPYIDDFIVQSMHGIPFAIIIYAIFWIAMPAAKTTRQNMEMRGYKTEIQMAKNHKHKNGGGFWKFITNFFKVIIKICVICMLTVIIIVCFTILIAGIASFWGGTLFGGINLMSLINYIDIGSTSALTVKFVIALIVFIPSCMLIYYSVKALFNFKCKDKVAGIILFTVWIFTVLLTVGKCVNIAKQYKYEEYITVKLELQKLDKSNVINISTSDDMTRGEIGLVDFDQNNLFFQKKDDKKSFYLAPNISINQVDSTFTPYVNISKHANATSIKNAKIKLKNIPDCIEIADSANIIIKPMRFDETKKWSSEKVSLTFYFPKTKTVNLNGDL